MKKGAIVITKVIGLVLVIISGFVVLLLTNTLNAEVLGLAKDETCLVSAYSNANSKLAGSDLVEYHCPGEIISVSLQDLDRDIDDSFKQILKKRGFVEDIEELQPGNEVLRQYNLDALMAKQLESCWRKTGEGKLDLFSNWQLETKKTNKNLAEAIFNIPIKTGSGIYNGIVGISKALYSTLSQNKEGRFQSSTQIYNSGDNFKEAFSDTKAVYNGKAPTFCVVCSVIKFNDPEIYKDSLLHQRNQEDLTLDKYLMYHEHKTSGYSKYEYLMDYPENGLEIMFNHYNYDVKQFKPQAIIFVRTNLNAISEATFKVINFMGSIIGVEDNIKKGNYDRALIVDYESIDNYCDIIVNPEMEFEKNE